MTAAGAFCAPSSEESSLDSKKSMSATTSANEMAITASQ